MPTPTDRFGLDTYDPGESWDHTDTVQFLDESAIEVDTIANRPTDGSYDGELFFATDQRILYQWDAGGSSWDVELGLGVDGTPVPGTSHFEALEADDVTWRDIPSGSSTTLTSYDGGSQKFYEERAQQATTVGTNATSILTRDLGVNAGYVVVYGSAENDFIDFLIVGWVNDVKVVDSLEFNGTPPARSYSSPDENLNLAMGSGVYRVAAKSTSLRAGD